MKKNKHRETAALIQPHNDFTNGVLAAELSDENIVKEVKYRGAELHNLWDCPLWLVVYLLKSRQSGFEFTLYRRDKNNTVRRWNRRRGKPLPIELNIKLEALVKLKNQRALTG